MHLTRTFTVAVAAALALTGLAAPAEAAGNGACTDPNGVTVVVDFTDVGGAVETGCALAPTTGTDALQKAGFVDTRDASGLICAIDATPDPCPATFTGSYWSYWSAEPGGSWQSYQVGSDTSSPTAGSVEGWRYSDGSAGPTVAVPAAATASATVASSPSASASGAPAAAATLSSGTGAPLQDGSSGGVQGWLIGALVLAGLVSVVGLVVRRRRTDV